MPFLPIGGQAVIEGVMMRSPSRMAVAVRRPDGSVAMLERPFVSITRRVKLLGLPVIRGAVSLFETIALGVQALNFSADEAERQADSPEQKKSTMSSVAQGLTMVVAFGLLLYVVLPASSRAGSGSTIAWVSGWSTACSGCWRSSSTCC